MIASWRASSTSRVHCAATERRHTMRCVTKFVPETRKLDLRILDYANSAVGFCIANCEQVSFLSLRSESTLRAAVTFSLSSCQRTISLKAGHIDVHIQPPLSDTSPSLVAHLAWSCFKGGEPYMQETGIAEVL